MIERTCVVLGSFARPEATAMTVSLGYTRGTNAHSQAGMEPPTATTR